MDTHKVHVNACSAGPVNSHTSTRKPFPSNQHCEDVGRMGSGSGGLFSVENILAHPRWGVSNLSQMVLV